MTQPAPWSPRRKALTLAGATIAAWAVMIAAGYGLSLIF